MREPGAPRPKQDDSDSLLWQSVRAGSRHDEPSAAREGEGVFRRLRREIEYEGFGVGVARLVFWVLQWPFRPLAFALRKLNEPVARFSASHGIARRLRSFFDRHKIVRGIVEAAIVLVWFAPVVALAVHHRPGLFPGKDIGKDVRGAWLLVVLSAGALAIGVMGNGPIAELAVAPEEDVDLVEIFVVFGMALGLPIVLALWAYGVF